MMCSFLLHRKMDQAYMYVYPLPFGLPFHSVSPQCIEQSSQCYNSMFSLVIYFMCRCVKLLQSCLTLCDPMDCSLPGSSVHGDIPGKNAGVGCHALLQGIFPTKGWNPRLLHLQVGSLLLVPPEKPLFCTQCQYCVCVSPNSSCSFLILEGLMGGSN